MRAVARLGLALGLALFCGWAEAAQWLKQSTAATVTIGPFVDETDAVTAETGLTISQADIRLSKNGGTYAQTNNATGATHQENGYYSVPLDTTDTNTLGRLRVAINESGALKVWADFLVVPANVYDSLVGGSDTLQADMTQVEGSDATDYIEGRTLASAGYFDPAADTVANVTTVGTVTNGVTVSTNNDKTGYSLSQAFPSNFADLAITATTGRVTVGTNSDKTGYSISGTLTTLDALDMAQDAQHAQTQSDIAGLNDLSAAAVNAEVDQALGDYDAPTKAELDAGFAALNDPTVAEIWGAATSGLTTAGTIGKLLVDNVDAAVSTRSDFDVSTDKVTVADVDGMTHAELFQRLASMSFGKVSRSGDTYTYYAQDGTTVVMTVTISSTARTVVYP